MKLDLQNLIDTPSRSRFTAQPQNAAAGPSDEDNLGDTLLQKMQEMRQSVAKLNTFSRSAKQVATGKAAMLKQRLEMLKSMLLYASPEAAKSIAQELKSIAHELASLAKNLGGSSASSVPTTGTTSGSADAETTSAPIDSVETEAASEGLETGTAAPEEAAASEDTEHATGKQATDKTSGTSNASTDGDDDDDALRAILLKARKLLKEAINQLKAKMELGDKEAKRDVEAAEENLGQLDQLLANGSGSSFYTTSGIPGTASIGSGLAVTAGLSGISVDIKA